MRKMIRKKVIKSRLEYLLAKYQSRIVKLSEQAYKLRKEIEAIDALTVQKPLTKADLDARDKAAEVVTDHADQEIGVTTAEAEIQ